MEISYVTREEVISSLEDSHTSRSNTEVDRKRLAASRSVEGLTHRRFYPEIRTMTFDWPNQQYAATWRLWLDEHELISATTITAGGTAIAASDYFLRPDDGPPYDRLEIDLASAAAFGGGDTHQRDISIAGLYGHKDIRNSAGAVVTGINSSTTTVDIKPLSGVLSVGVGSLIVVDSERMNVTERRMLDTTQNLQSNVDDDHAARTIAVSDGTAFAIGEVILIDSERMLVTDIAGNNLFVDRAYDGTTLADHTSTTDIYALRRYTVERAALGTTAAAHDADDIVYVQEFPSLIREYVNALAVAMLVGGENAYSMDPGSGPTKRSKPGTYLAALADEVRTTYGRISRLGAV